MANIDSAFSVRNGVSLDDELGIFHGSIDPSSSGFEAPVGSLYLSDSGDLYIKSDTGDTDWGLVSTASGITKYKCSIKTSGGTFTWSGSAGEYTATITAASHGITISDYDVVVKCYQLDGTDYVEVIPSDIRIESDDDVVIEMPTNDDLYVMVLG